MTTPWLLFTIMLALALGYMVGTQDRNDRAFPQKLELSIRIPAKK